MSTGVPPSKMEFSQHPEFHRCCAGSKDGKCGLNVKSSPITDDGSTRRGISDGSAAAGSSTAGCCGGIGNLLFFLGSQISLSKGKLSLEVSYLTVRCLCGRLSWVGALPGSTPSAPCDRRAAGQWIIRVFGMREWSMFNASGTVPLLIGVKGKSALPGDSRVRWVPFGPMTCAGDAFTIVD